MLINPIWNPREGEHVAISGVIDLTGDGRNNIDEFIANPYAHGVVVDASSKKRITRSRTGMTLNTTYLITEMPRT